MDEFQNQGRQENEEGPRRPRGRYRFRGGRPVDPNEGLHPEMVEDNLPQSVAAGIPDSPQQLIAMQTKAPRPEKPERGPSPKVKEVLELIDRLDTSACEDQQIALFLVRHLESYHDSVVEDMQEDAAADHGQIVAWAVDADRLLRARLLLDSVDL